MVVLSLMVPVGATDFHYYVDSDGSVVITDTVSRADAEPLPGFYQERERRMGSAIPASHFDDWMRKIARRHALRPELVRAVAWVESGFNTHAVSPKGAVGLMQLMPGTAGQYGVTDRKDPLQNLDAGAKHLRYLLDLYEGDLSLALAAYNAGEGTVKRYGGIPPYKETQKYVTRIRQYLEDPGARKMTTESPSGRPKATRPAADPAGVTVLADGTVVISNQ